MDAEDERVGEGEGVISTEEGMEGGGERWDGVG